MAARQQRKDARPLSVRFSRTVRDWLDQEARQRSETAGARVGPSTIVRTIIEREVRARGTSFRAWYDEFRKEWSGVRLMDEDLADLPAFDATPEPPAT